MNCEKGRDQFAGNSIESPHHEPALSPMPTIERLPDHIKINETHNLDMRLGLAFTDVGETYGVEIRHGVCEVHQQIPYHTDATLVTTKQVFAQSFGDEGTLSKALNDGSVKILGDPAHVRKFFGCFAQHV
jgi:alkyl sulfatase BDS1-like metallo-beta-lactamase superfamily hydrolase